MFDPHRTRRTDKRYYTRKGQVIQASRVNTKPVIDQRLVPVYKNYLIANNLIPLPSPPSPPPVILPTIDSVQFSEDSNIYPISAMDLTNRGVTIQGKSQTIILSTFTQSRTFWRVDLLFLPSPGATYMIPAGCRYLSFPGDSQVNDSFSLFANGKKLISLNQVQSNDFANTVWIQTNFISKDLVNFSDVPA